MPEDEAVVDDAPKKGLPLMPIIAVAAVLLIEAVVIVGLFMLSGGPEEATANEGVADEVALLEQPVEIQVVRGKFQNTASGRNLMYDTEIYVVVKKKHQEKVEEKVEAMQASIRRDVTTIFRRANPAQLREQELSTLTRQVRAALDVRFGNAPLDPDAPVVKGDDGASDKDAAPEPLIQEVLVAKCMEFASDF
ncbi:MAG: hypothetical protein V3V20_07100 [Algisphaera sp.]